MTLINIIFLFLAEKALTLDNGLATTPQMGWNDWNAYGCSVSEDLVLKTSNYMSQYGLLAAGYEYVNVDDCWSTSRDPTNNTILVDYSKFPHGMAYVADQLHASGFKFGMYSDAGNKTCGGYPGSLGYEEVDAFTFASWGVDYLKYDNCNNDGIAGSQDISSARYKSMTDALNATGRPILYSLCNWGQDQPWVWGPSVGNSWRIAGDIFDNFGEISPNCIVPGPSAQAGGYQCSVANIISQLAPVASYGSSGGWNDLDMLEVGNGQMSDAGYMTHFSMWSVLKSPLIIGTDISSLSTSDFSILVNPAIIAVNQDPLGISAQLRWNTSNTQLWSGPLSPTGNLSTTLDMVVALVNIGNSTANIEASMSDIFAGQTPGVSNWAMNNLWGARLNDTQAQSIMSDGAAAHTDWIYNATDVPYGTGLAQKDPLLLGTYVQTVSANDTIEVTVEGNGCAILRLQALQ